jgi:hypothetical protein
VTHVLLRTVSGNITDNSLQAEWDFQAENVTVAHPLEYKIQLSQIPDQNFQDIPADSLPIEDQIIYEPPFFGGIVNSKYTVAWGYSFEEQALVNSMSSVMASDVVCVLDSGDNLWQEWGCDYKSGGYPDYSLLPTTATYPGNDPVTPSAFQWFSTGKDMEMLTNSLKDPASRNFYWFGRGWQDMISPGLPNSAFGFPLPVLAATDVQNMLQNHTTVSLGFNFCTSLHPYRLVVLDCCYAGTVAWAQSFGIPDSMTSIYDYKNPQQEANAFVGWYGELGVPCDSGANYVVQDFQALGEAEWLFHVSWMCGVEVQQCVESYVTYLIANGPSFQATHMEYGNKVYDEATVVILRATHLTTY